MRRGAKAVFLSAALMVLGAERAQAQTAYEHFESPQVHPARLTPDGTKLLVANTADSRLSVFNVSNPRSPALMAEIPVGLEPVSVNARTNDEVWVVNYVSDSISIVSLSQGLVVDTLRVGDEPADVVFAGSPQRAFVTVARRNEVKVYDAATRALVGTIPLQGEHPRALAVNAAGDRVYAAFALSGNRTTIIPEEVAPPPPAPTNPLLPAPPQVGLIVDATNPTWSTTVRYTLPDNDVVEINANTQSVVRYVPRVGTVNLGLAVQPSTGNLYVANTDARNLVRFEPNLRDNFVSNRISRVVLGSTPTVTPVELNPSPSRSTALAQPTDLAFESSGSHLWVASFGTDRVARVDAGTGGVVARVAIGPNTSSRTKRGPRGLALHASSNTLYVVNRISNTLSVVDTANAAAVAELNVGGVDPTPAAIRVGRGFLYDAMLSGRGTSSCASCHVDAELDLLAWDLGNPGGSMQTVQNSGQNFSMHPMKGPMTTQTLKGLRNTEPLHWRGDKATFNDFNGAFDSLLGGAVLPAADMQAFTDFILTVRMSPNPHRNLDDTLPASFAGADPRAGESFFLNTPFRGTLTCNQCHSITNGGTNQVIFPGTVLGTTQPFKTAQLRNMYHKNSFRKTVGGQSVGGYGFSHDGADATLDEFLSHPVFGTLTTNPTARANLNAFLLNFPTGMAPAVGYSRTVSAANATSAAVTTDVALLESQAQAGKIDLIVKGKLNGVARGLFYNRLSRVYEQDAAGAPTLSWTQLQSLAASGQSQFTLMGVPPGTGKRMGIDRDADGVLDADE
ncbi:MAG TPA: YncE family protein [Archangium sp.]|uniref:YncE family protein n=1 Tax=Archangium sp. TaxID=1872627 RepID=UPI002E33FBB5|nr:YncE family protein [Archangium sp.]HEX5752970.1 YncE family protein [Archangium sp.]